MTDDYGAILAELSRLSVTVRTIVAQHVPDGDGLCTGPGCGRPGTGTPHVPHPCPTRSLADAAATIARRRARVEPARRAGTP